MKKHIIPALILSIFIFASIKAETVRSLKEYKLEKISLRTDTVLKIQDTKFEIGLVAFTEDKHIFRTTGFLKGKLRWKNFVVKAEGATFYNGKLTVTRTAAENYSPVIPVSFYSVYEPEKIFHDTITLNYLTNIQLFATNYFPKIPGATVKLGMNITYDNGDSKTFRNLNWMDHFSDDYEVLVRSGSYHKDEFSFFSNVIDISDHTCGIMVESRINPSVYDVLEYKLDYKSDFQLNANGSWGFSGSSGFSGFSGGTGESGRPGEYGKPGYNGDDGHDLDVFIDAYYDSILNQTLVKAYIGDLNTSKAKWYLINPDGGSLYISAQGGDGGKGGDGGNGGTGGTGKNGDFYTEIVKETVVTRDTAGKEIRTEVERSYTRQHPGSDGGCGGDGGWGGPGGSGGNGGFVIVNYTPAAKPYLPLIKINVRGGSSGIGGDGGRGGDGGNGGSGNPSGRKGRIGRYGANGPYGYEGNSGNLEYKEVKSIPW